MERTEIKKIEQPDFTASLRTTPRQLIIHDEKLVPEAYWVPQPPKLDRRRLTAVLTGEVSVAGAALGSGGMTVSVKTK